MFKKTILAAALVSTATLSNAASFHAGEVLKVIHTKQGIQAITGAGVAAGDALLKLGVEYAVNDTVTFTSSVAKATGGAWPTSITSSVPTSAATSCLINDTTPANLVAASTTLTLDNCTGVFTANDYVTIAGATTGEDTLARVVSKTDGGGATTEIVIPAPGLLFATADNKPLTQLLTKRVVLTLANQTATAATYRVSAIGALLADGTTASLATSSIGSLIPFEMPNINPTALNAAGTAKLTTTSATGAGLAMDTNATAATVADSIEGFTFALPTKFSKTVSVDLNRKKFDDNSSSDGLIYTSVAKSGTAGREIDSGAVAPVIAAVNATSLSVTTGDWSFLDTNAATAGIQLSATSKITVGSTVNPVALTFNTAGTVATVTDTAVRATHAFTAENPTTAASADLPVQSYAASYTVKATPSTGSQTDFVYALAAGAWTLNASTITAFGVPMGTGVSRFLWINNKGITAGDITASFTQSGVTTSLGSIGTAAIKASTEIGSLVDAALVTAAVTPTANSRATIAVTVTSPAADITMSAAYKVDADSDRLIIETSDSLD